MKRNRFFVLATILVLMFLLAVGSYAQNFESVELSGDKAIVAEAVSFQGRFTDPTTGDLLDGDFDLEFSFWSASTDGTQVGTTTALNDQTITEGLYQTNLAISADDIDGEELWLSINMREAGTTEWETLSPRQQMLPGAFAMTLRPGAHVEGDVASPDAIIDAANTSDGPGLIGWSQDGNGVEGSSQSTNGVYGVTAGTSANQSGVYGVASDTANGVHGYQSTSPNGLGVYGKHVGGGAATSGYNLGSGNGVWGYSEDYRGVASGTGRVDQNYGLHTSDNLYSLNYHKSGAVMQVVKNGGSDLLNRGDVVEIAGIERSPGEVDTPIIQVRKASRASSTGVLGVVDSTYSAAWLKRDRDPTGSTGPSEVSPLSTPGPVAPDDYLLVVVQGPALVNVDALDSDVSPGDLLTSANQEGYATKVAELDLEDSETRARGTVLGKALEPLTQRSDLIYVYVTLQ